MITVPLVLILALVFGGAGSPDPGSHPSSAAVLPAVSVSPGEASDSATVSTCAQIISGLPLTLAGLTLRRTVSTPPTSSVVAWGDPAIVLRCGVAKPKALNPSLTDQYTIVNGMVWLKTASSDSANVFTVVDRAVYLDVSVPTEYPQPPLGPITTAIAKALPKAVCVADNSRALAQQCTRRK